MRTVFFKIYLALYMLVTTVYALKVKILDKMGKKEEKKAYVDKITSNWGRHMMRAVGGSVEVIGVENIPDRNVLYVSNHVGNADIPLLLGYLPKPKGFIAKIELKKVPIISFWMKQIGCLFIDRSSIRQSMDMILQGIEMLKNGNSLVVFPEGTRSKGKEIGEFKKGSLQLAVKSGVPVVPVTIYNSHKVYEEHNAIKPAKIKVVVHQPIYLENLSKEEKKDLAEIVRKVIMT